MRINRKTSSMKKTIYPRMILKGQIKPRNTEKCNTQKIKLSTDFTKQIFLYKISSHVVGPFTNRFLTIYYYPSVSKIPCHLPAFPEVLLLKIFILQQPKLNI